MDMAYDRYDTRNAPRDERSRWRDERFEARDRGRDERGFFERAGDEVASWFGDEEAERRRREDHLRDERERGWGGRERDFGRDYDRERERGSFFGGGRDEDRRLFNREPERSRGSFFGGDRDWNSRRDEDRFAGGGRWTSSDRDWRERDFGRSRERESGYRPMTGDYGRSERGFSEDERFERDRSQSPWGRDEIRRTSRAGSSDWSDRSRHEDPHYESWRQRHMSELDRDFEDYRREHQSRFEDEFGSWREKRQQKRGLLGQIREHMEVVGNDGQHVGTIDRVAGDRLILTKSDPESGGSHHSLSCADLDRVEGDRIILDCSAEQAKQRWRDESRNRALFEREDQGEMGPRMLDRSFEGTYR
jgi:hypothetical protein